MLRKLGIRTISIFRFSHSMNGSSTRLVGLIGSHFASSPRPDKDLWNRVSLHRNTRTHIPNAETTAPKRLFPFPTLHEPYFGFVSDQ